MTLDNAIEPNIIIRVELEHMKHAMLQHLSNYSEAISKYVEQALERQIETFDYGAAVRTAAEKAIDVAIRGYFQWGNGNSMINDAIVSALSQIVKTTAPTGTNAPDAIRQDSDLADRVWEAANKLYEACAKEPLPDPEKVPAAEYTPMVFLIGSDLIVALREFVSAWNAMLDEGWSWSP